MAKKKSSNPLQSLIKGRGLVGTIIIVLAVFIISSLLYGPQQALNTVLGMLGAEVPEVAESTEGGSNTISGPVGEEISGEGTYYSVYFTNPVIPFDDVTTGGNDKYLVELINNAQSTIDLAVFEFELDSVLEALIAAHERGVRVRVVYDDEHTEEDPQMEELLDAGIEGVPDERSAFMHNKFFVFDGQIVWTGSMNITTNGVYRNNNNVIVIRSSKLAENYTAEFEEMFLDGEFGPRSPSDTPNPVFTLDGVQIESFFASEDEIMPRIVELVNEAQSSVHFMAFAFTEDDLGIAMANRLSAGVEVSGIFETRGSGTEHSECTQLLNNGADVRLDSNPRTFHHKVIIIDESILIVGSFNFSNNAISSNDENLLIIHDPEVAALYEAEFDKWYATAEVQTGANCAD